MIMSTLPTIEEEPGACRIAPRVWNGDTKSAMIAHDKVSMITTGRPSPSGWIMFQKICKRLNIVIIEKK